MQSKTVEHAKNMGQDYNFCGFAWFLTCFIIFRILLRRLLHRDASVDQLFLGTTALISRLFVKLIVRDEHLFDKHMPEYDDAYLFT